MLPYIDGSIGYFPLKTRGRSETKRDIMIHIEKILEAYHEVSFVIGFNRDCAIGTFHIQHGRLGSWRSGCHLRRDLSDYMVVTRREGEKNNLIDGGSLISMMVSFKRNTSMGPRYTNNFLRKIREERIIIIIMITIEIT